MIRGIRIHSTSPPQLESRDEIAQAVSEGILQNQREHARVPIRAQVICIADTRTLRGVTCNISQGGIQVEMPELRKRANLQLTFRLPHRGTIIEALGFVIWVSDRRNGIKFKQVGAQSNDLIRHFIEEYTKLS